MGASLKVLQTFAVIAASTPGGDTQDVWKSCLAEVRSERDSKASSAPVPVWIHGPRERSYLSGGGWVCNDLDDTAGDEVCRSCRWFDTRLPGSLSASGKLGHLDLKISAAECLDGSFLDKADAGAWLRRNELVHLGRYAAACISPERSAAGGWFSDAVYAAWIALTGACCLLCNPACRKLCASSQPEADDFNDVPRPVRPPPWEKYKEASYAAESRSDHSAFRSSSASSSDWEVFPVGLVEPNPAAQKIINAIQQDLLANLEAPEADRKQIMRKYLMRWHPDKNTEEDKETATAVIQFLNSKKVWFLEPGAIPETTPLLP